VRLAAAALAAVALSAGCGSSKPAVPGAWKDEAEQIAAALDAGQGCRAKRLAVALQRQFLAAVNAGEVAPDRQEEVGGAIGLVAGEIRCFGGRQPQAEQAAKRLADAVG
jgi:hypothetical protein